MPVFVWKIKCKKLQQYLIGNIHPPEIVNVLQMKVANIWNKI